MRYACCCILFEISNERTSFYALFKEDGMKQSTKTTLFALSVAILGLSAAYACKKPIVQKEKASHIVVDRLINQLVCKFDVRSRSSQHYPRGIVGGKRGGDDYTMRSSSSKAVVKREGLRRGEVRRPAGSDVHP